MPVAKREIICTQFTPSQFKKFWRRVDKSGGPDACWWWTNPRSERVGKYGEFIIWRTGWPAHRVSFALAYGVARKGFLVRHTCEKPGHPEDTSYRKCVNPKHLEEGTIRQNARDAMQRGRIAYGVRNGSAKLTQSQVLEMRRRHAAGESCPTLAKAFGIKQP